MEYRKWYKKLLIFAAILLALASTVMYVADPLFVYRYREGCSYWIQPEWVSAGLAKNYKYDTALIGSSVAQNFDSAYFAEKLSCHPVKMTISAISVTEIGDLASYMQREEKAETIYIGLDLQQFAVDKTEDKDRIKEEWLDRNPLNDYTYLWSYEAWSRFLPLDLAIGALKVSGIPLPERVQEKTDPARSGEWEAVCGRDQVKQYYLSGQYAVSPVKLENMEERMRGRVDEMMDRLEFDGKQQYVFFFPPYSALYWYRTQEDGYYEIYQDIKTYMEERILEQPGTVIFDFQAQEKICDLDNYRDYIHYGAHINQWMTDCFADGSYRVMRGEEGKNRPVLDELVEQFRVRNADWLYMENGEVKPE